MDRNKLKVNAPMKRITTTLLLCALPGCFLIPDGGETGGTGGEEIPAGYPTFFVGESRIHTTAPAGCIGPDIAISMGNALDHELLTTNDTTKTIIFGTGYDWKGVLHCDPAADASCATIEHRVSDWADAHAPLSAIFVPDQRDDAMFSDSATLSVYIGNGSATTESLSFPENMPSDGGAAQTCKIFWANGVKLNDGSVGPQGANGLVLAAPCFGNASLWGGGGMQPGEPTSPLVGTQHPNRIYAFGGSALMLAEDALAVWWDTLVWPGQYSWHVAEDWHHWHHALNQQGNVYSNLPVVISFRQWNEEIEDFEDRATLSNIRTGYRFEENPTKETFPVITDWVYYDAPTLCG